MNDLAHNCYPFIREWQRTAEQIQEFLAFPVLFQRHIPLREGLKCIIEEAVDWCENTVLLTKADYSPI